MTSYSHELELTVSEFRQLLTYIASELEDQPFLAGNWASILWPITAGYQREDQVYRFALEDYQVDSLTSALGEEIQYRGRPRMVSTSSFCWPDGKIPKDAFDE